MLAVGPTTNTAVSQSIYYAADIGGGPNTVTVDFNGSVNYPCLAVLEYSGVSHLGQTSIGIGVGQAAYTNPVTTAGRSLVFGAGNPDSNAPPDFASPGSGFDQRVISSVTGMLAEDQTVSQAGTYQVTGALSASTPWVMQLATFE
jgi:hypothetical protein